MQTELLDRFLSVARFCDQLHVRFSVDQSGDPLAEKRMIVNGKDPNRGPRRSRIVAHEFAPLSFGIAQEHCGQQMVHKQSGQG
jgi:hypothetical protein